MPERSGLDLATIVEILSAVASNLPVKGAQIAGQIGPVLAQLLNEEKTRQDITIKELCARIGASIDEEEMLLVEDYAAEQAALDKQA
jgi:hypothetical protein